MAQVSEYIEVYLTINRDLSARRLQARNNLYRDLGGTERKVWSATTGHHSEYDPPDRETFRRWLMRSIGSEKELDSFMRRAGSVALQSRGEQGLFFEGANYDVYPVLADFVQTILSRERIHRRLSLIEAELEGSSMTRDTKSDLEREREGLLDELQSPMK